MGYVEIEGHIIGGGACEELREIILYDISTDKAQAVFQVGLPGGAFASLDAGLYIKNGGVKLGIFAAEKYAVGGMGATDIQQLSGCLGNTYPIDNFTAHSHG